MVRKFALLFGLLLPWLATVAMAKDFRVHALLVVDTAADAKLTHGIAKAGQRMSDLLASLPEQDRERLQITILQGEDATVERIRAFYRNLPSDPMDVLFFYYMGHGTVKFDRKNGDIWGGKIGVDRGSRNSATGVSSGFPESSDPRYHFLTLHHGWLSRVELYHLMMGCQSRACILFADCCGSFLHGEEGVVEGPQGKYVDAAKAYASRMRGEAVDEEGLARPGTINARLWRKLMYDHMGLIDVGGAPIGYYGLAWPIYGGMSSFAFTESLCASDTTLVRLLNQKTNWPEQNGLPDWQTFLTYLLAPQYRRDFPQQRSERRVGGEERIHEYGPRLFDPLGLAFHTPRIQQLPGSTAVFGDGIVCRLQPIAGKGGGFFPVYEVDGEGVNIYTSSPLLDRIMAREASKIRLSMAYDQASGAKDAKTFELQIRRP